MVLLNNDVQLGPDCLERLVAPSGRTPAIGSVAAVMLAPGERTIDSVGVTADPDARGLRAPAGTAGLRGAAAREPVLTGPEGTAGAYRREAWEQVGGLDEAIRRLHGDPRSGTAAARRRVEDGERPAGRRRASRLEHVRPPIAHAAAAVGLQPRVPAPPLRRAARTACGADAW